MQVKQKETVFSQSFRIAVLTEIQNKIFAVDTMNATYVYDITNNYEEVKRFRLSYNILVPIQPYYFLTAGIVDNFINIFDCNTISVVKQIKKIKLIQPFIGYFEKSEKIYLTATCNKSGEMLIDARSLKIEKTNIHRTNVKFMSPKDIGTVKELFKNVVVF